MSRLSGTSLVVGRTSKQGDIDDVRIYTAPSGLNYIEIARDARDLSRRFYVIDRRLVGDPAKNIPKGPWKRLLRSDSFNKEATPDHLSEVRAEVQFEEIPNYWGITAERTWGLPAGMESPWTEPVEMVGNELLLPEGAEWVSGDAPVNITRDNFFSNGKYGVKINNNLIQINDEYTGEGLANLTTDTRGLFWQEGTAGAALFQSGSVHIEPAKPPIFMGSFSLDQQPEYLLPGLYQYGQFFLITSVPVTSQVYTGLMAIVKDPFPERWVPRVFCRAYTSLISPAYSPPLIEDEPERISVRVEKIPSDFEDQIEPKTITPYGNKTGVFNSWEIDTPPCTLAPRERPYDVLLPLDDLEDWGGHPVWNPGDFFPARDKWDQPKASYPTEIPFEMPEIPEIEEGMLFFRWKDSAYFNVFNSEWMDILYKQGWIYFENKVSPDSNGIARISPLSDWNDTKIEWGKRYLLVNDIPALTDERDWMDVLVGDDHIGPTHTWGNILQIPQSGWQKNPEYPLDVEQYEEVPVDWVTGNPEWESERPDPTYEGNPISWGRVLYEPYDSAIAKKKLLAGDTTIRVSDLTHEPLRDYE